MRSPFRRQRVWLHVLLFLLTLATTTLVGAALAANFEQNLPAVRWDEDWEFFTSILSHPERLRAGLPFSLTLLTILLSHELGHYLTCLYHRVDASLPYFLPAPTVIGTFGAFIRIRSPIFSRAELFDIGVAGPLAGFLFLIPALGIGLAYSKILPGIAHQGDITFGTPPLLWLAQQAVFPGSANADIYLHPVARAAWAGTFATALNLLPIGQLDGGHILYSVYSGRHRLISRVVAAVLLVIGPFSWWGWTVWAIFFLLTGLRRPPIMDDRSVSAGRLRLAVLAAAIFLLSFTPSPIEIRSAIAF